jgi:hypothetical protein
MPETSPDLNNALAAGNHNVWLAGQLGRMETKAESHRVDEPTDCHLRFCPFTADSAHVLAAPFTGNRVDHASDYEIRLQHATAYAMR